MLDTVLFLMTIAKFRYSRVQALGKRTILATIVWDGTWAYALSFGEREGDERSAPN